MNKRSEVETNHKVIDEYSTKKKAGNPNKNKNMDHWSNSYKIGTKINGHPKEYIMKKTRRKMSFPAAQCDIYCSKCQFEQKLANLFNYPNILKNLKHYL